MLRTLWRLVSILVTPAALLWLFRRWKGVAHKITFKEGPALPVLDELVKDERNHGSYDFIFVDADKDNYLNYHKRLIDLVKVGGVIGSAALPTLSESFRSTRFFFSTSKRTSPRCSSEGSTGIHSSSPPPPSSPPSSPPPPPSPLRRPDPLNLRCPLLFQYSFIPFNMPIEMPSKPSSSLPFLQVEENGNNRKVGERVNREDDQLLVDTFGAVPPSKVSRGNAKEGGALRRGHTGRQYDQSGLYDTITIIKLLHYSSTVIVQYYS
ncbi:hypothetical protein K1719_028943 [Acacia pycnantha]|nr:hypothetical protein K1719_028943 [Acacia pycnantha]